MGSQSELRSVPLLLAISLVFPCAGETPRSGQPLPVEFRADSRLVLVPVAVTDRQGANIRGLRKENFTVLDNRHTQPIAAFYSEEAPCSIGLVMDISGSMSQWLSWEKRAIHALVQSSDPGDDYFMATVPFAPTLLRTATSDSGFIEDQARFVKAGGWTALDDTIHLAAEQLTRSARTCRALVVLSDGMDNRSHWSGSSLLDFLMESDIQVYTIAMEGPQQGKKAIELAEIRRGLCFMNDVAERTGGLNVSVRPSALPSDAAARITAALRNRYVIAYRLPKDNLPDKWHTIQVKMNRSGVNVYARRGYRVR